MQNNSDWLAGTASEKGSSSEFKSHSLEDSISPEKKLMAQTNRNQENDEETFKVGFGRQSTVEEISKSGQ